MRAGATMTGAAAEAGLPGSRMHATNNSNSGAGSVLAVLFSVGEFN